MKKVYLKNGTEAIEAVYHDFPLQEFNDNPFIQVLNPLHSKSSIIKKMTMKPSFNFEERHVASHYRIYMLQRLFQLFQPLPIHIEVWEMIHKLIIDGYIARNPFNKEYVRYLNESGKNIINGTYEVTNNVHFRTTSSCGTFIGFSGMGKTTSVNRVLHNIPQVIIHNKYKGNHFNQIQLVWLKLDAPPTSSLKALCLQFFLKVDEILGTNNYQRYVSRNSSVDAMLPVISQLAHNIGLGVLIIDELQNIRNRGAKQILNFFVNLINSGINVALIGTPGSYRLFSEELRIARRLTGNTEIIYENMDYGKEFNFLLESIWKYQWTKDFTPLDEEFAKVMYEYTQGISDLMVKLFVYSQHYAIESGVERLSTNLIKKVAKERFRALKPMLEAIRSGNPYKISKYEDILKRDLFQKEAKTNLTSSMRLQKPKVNAKKSIDNSQPEVTSIRPPKKQIYVKRDIRLIVRSDPSKTVYDHLKDNGFIDDLSEWM